MLDDIWKTLRSDKLGFYTFADRAHIPSSPGVYAWFLPLRKQGEIRHLVEKVTKILSFDASTGEIANWKTSKAGFNWEPMSLSLEKNPKHIAERLLEILAKKKSIEEFPAGEITCIKETLLAASIFSRPLYVGLASDLKGRYSDHTEKRGPFRQRFETYTNECSIDLKVRHLIYACVSLTGKEQRELLNKKEALSIIEEILKAICQPVFSRI